FLGHQPRDALFALYRGAQAVIVPSWWHEPFGMIAIEAWAASTPVIARRAGALEELVRTSGGGILYEDEAGLREAIRSLENNPRMRDQLAARGHAAFRAQWTEEKHLERYFALLAQLGVSP
ncbi:MAG: glycosyltransferase family 4 protein, partial [Planctomycetes bacterium]|nr:glycosyltransferase family 4 protein [Planctomycetota bacterium]